MNRFTISPEFLESCAQDPTCYYLLNVLMVLAQDNQFKLCMDKGNLASSRYADIIRKSEPLQFWIKMLNLRTRNIEVVVIPKGTYSTNQDLFLAIANMVLPQKKLVTSNKSIYDDWQKEVIGQGITLIDGDEAKSLMQAPPIIQISYGDFSPNIQGNQNTIR